MTLFAKIKWILGVALVFFIVLTTNLVDRQNFSAVSDSIETIYADRLVAQDIISNLYSAVHEKELNYLRATVSEASQNMKTINAGIEDNIIRFAATKLTPAEAEIFNRLKEELSRLQEKEEAAENGNVPGGGMENSLNKLKVHLDKLSEIQMTEGRRELFESKKALSSAQLFTQLEIAALVIMAIAVQVIILYTPGMEDAD